ncbi:MAG: T9SS type A sorting domain-containing protein [Cyclobacteriaceae bacterium]
MPKYAMLLLLCIGVTCSTAQIKHTVSVSVNQGLDCPVVSGLSEFDHIKVYPNPVRTSSFTIETDFETGGVELRDLRGTLMLSDEIVNGKVEIDVNQIYSGIYFITISDKSNVYKVKIQIK